ncbi:hypothetical protein HAX54_021687, partial [Datura stramonium]|nr:hypothetical protein [Datura stramonium]
MFTPTVDDNQDGNTNTGHLHVHQHDEITEHPTDFFNNVVDDVHFHTESPKEESVQELTLEQSVQKNSKEQSLVEVPVVNDPVLQESIMDVPMGTDVDLSL